MSLTPLMKNPPQFNPQAVDGPLDTLGNFTSDGPIEGGWINVVSVFDFAAPLDFRLGRAQSFVMQANTSISSAYILNMLEGLPYVITVHQDSVGGHVLSYPSNWFGMPAVSPGPLSTTKFMIVQDEDGNVYNMGAVTN
jgi:hypothetical protein